MRVPSKLAKSAAFVCNTAHFILTFYCEQLKPNMYKTHVVWYVTSRWVDYFSKEELTNSFRQICEQKFRKKALLGAQKKKIFNFECYLVKAGRKSQNVSFILLFSVLTHVTYLACFRAYCTKIRFSSFYNFLNSASSRHVTMLLLVDFTSSAHKNAHIHKTQICVQLQRTNDSRVNNRRGQYKNMFVYLCVRAAKGWLDCHCAVFSSYLKHLPGELPFSYSNMKPIVNHVDIHSGLRCPCFARSHYPESWSPFTSRKKALLLPNVHTHSHTLEHTSFFPCSWILLQCFSEISPSEIYL